MNIYRQQAFFTIKNYIAVNLGIYLENIYKSLEVNEINCNVEVAVRRYFSTELPSSLKDGINALNAFLSAAMGTDRNKLFRTWLRYRRSARDLNKEEIEKYFKNLVEKFYLYKISLKFLNIYRL